MKKISKQEEYEAKRLMAYNRNTKKCKCGCSVFFAGKKERIICRWCGEWVYKDAEAEFKFKMQEKLKK